MTRNDVYVDLQGHAISLAKLDEEERKLVSALRRRAATKRNWTDFDNFWMDAVARFYDARGLTRKQSRRTEVFQIAQDLSARLAVESGRARLSDYRDELAELVTQQFPTRRAFCKATGLSEDLLSHVLAHRKHVSIRTLTEALDRIGYALHITPAPSGRRTG
jgi:hypothetical protein